MKRICIVTSVVAVCLWVWPSFSNAFESGPFPDFDEDGVVGFADFLQFAGSFGAQQGEESYEERFDLDGDGSIGFPDFLIFAGTFGKASPDAGDENDVNIPDANLRAVIADSLGKARDAPITRAEMATLTELESHEADIKDLTGLQFAANLESLWLTYNPLSDLTPLCDLTGLRVLVLYGNSIANLVPLSGLENLTDVHLNDNRISDLSPLAALTNLKSLTLGGNEISDVSALASLVNLETLALFRNAISNISDLSVLINLTELDLADNTISDVSAISGLTKLNVLNLGDNTIPVCSSDLSALSNLTLLTRLNLNDNRIFDLSEIVANEGLGSGDVVDVRDNLLNVQSLSSHVPALQSRGVDVRIDSRVPVQACLPIHPRDTSVDAGSSHTLQTNQLFVDRERIRIKGSPGRVHAVAYLDFNGDGNVDVFLSPLDDTPRPTPAELYLNNGAGCFSPDTSLFEGNPPGLVHPRKALPGDFNGDGRMDVFVLGHGYDQPPFPGEAPYVILSSADGYVLGSGLESFVGFQHGGASADIDADGDIDVLITHLRSEEGPFFLLNDGSGSFALDVNRIEGLADRALFTTELVDVDGDGILDLLAAGHEYDPSVDNMPTQILWGDSTGVYSTDRATILPAVSGSGIVVDVDVSDTDGDGDNDIVINRTGDERTTVYQGYYLQLVEQVSPRRFEDRTEFLLSENEDFSADWFDWIRMCDCDADGDVDIVVDDAARNLIWKNDGTGAFRPR